MNKTILRQMVNPALTRLLTGFIALVATAHLARAETLTSDPTSVTTVAGQASTPLIRSSPEDREIKVRVPYDYKSSSLGSFDLYAKIHGGLNTKLQTVVMINGGPGQSSEGVVPFAQSLRRLGYNVITFDQRGIRRSAFASESLLDDPKILNSENTARDIEELRKQLKIEKLVIWGWSYGTVPARIYGSLFPQKTKHIVSVGTLAHVWNRGQTLLVDLTNEMVLKRLNRGQRNLFEAISFEEKMLLPSYVGIVAHNFGKKGVESFATQLAQILSQGGAPSANLFGDAYKLTQAEVGRKSLAAARLLTPEDSSDRVFQNLSALDGGAAVFDGISNVSYTRIRGFIASTTTSDEDINKFLDEKNQDRIVYDPKNYPLTVPTTFVQGGFDTTTSINNIKRLRDRVGKESARLIYFTDDGHYASVSQLIEDDVQSVKFRENILKKLIDLKPFTAEELAEVGARQI